MLEVALSQGQVDVANQLRRLYLPGWQRADAVLQALEERFPSNTDPVCVIPKAVTLNRLYATNVFAILAMADHVVEVLSAEPDPPGINVVEKISRLHGLGQAGDKSRRFLSFASKYCHFFVDSACFPILDDFAGRALSYHLGRRNRSPMRGTAEDYPNYVADINRLRATAGIDCGYAQLDHYLWLCGQWLEYQRRKESGDPGPINGEVWSLFRSPADASTRAMLAEAFAAPQST